MKLEVFSISETIKIIEDDFGFSSPIASRIGAIAEHLRAATAVESLIDDTHTIVPVPTVRITSGVRNRLSRIWPDLGLSNEKSESVVLDELDRLATLGDVTAVGSKGWVTSPIRLVHIDNSNYLWIGGGSLQILPFHVRSNLQVVGRARILSTQERSQSAYPVQKLSDWLALPYDDVLAWSKARFKHATLDMAPVAELDNVSVYLRGHWLPISEYKGPTDYLMFRQLSKIYGSATNIYGVGKVRISQGSSPVIEKASIINRDDARRLQGGIGLWQKNQEVFLFSRGQKTVKFRINHPLPNPEAKILNLGWALDVADSARPWPREYMFSSRLLPFLSQAFSLLGYMVAERLTEKKNDI